ncbi:hypothetical protein WMY93_022827 [Mugilogobius chulae]|uniref:Uncharacterized protein n=1 Tax=Mugilogobius chulae TaxID=88201 RepID=A0AAW0NCX9_9GOBI
MTARERGGEERREGDQMSDILDSLSNKACPLTQPVSLQIEPGTPKASFAFLLLIKANTNLFPRAGSPGPGRDVCAHRRMDLVMENRSRFCRKMQVLGYKQTDRRDTKQWYSAEERAMRRGPRERNRKERPAGDVARRYCPGDAADRGKGDSKRQARPRMSRKHTYRRKEKAEGACPYAVWHGDVHSGAGGARKIN